MNITPTRQVRLSIGDALAADPDTFAPPTDANKISLIASDFTPSEDLELADFTLATFTGSAAKSFGVGDQNVGIDPITGDQVVVLLDPTGGYRWACTVAPLTPEVIYGFAVTNMDVDVLLATCKLPTPITIENVNDQIVIGSVEVRLLQTPFVEV